ncbi:hypothetical protein Btru_078055, partial [Bulinus truncatus]
LVCYIKYDVLHNIFSRAFRFLSPTVLLPCPKGAAMRGELGWGGGTRDITELKQQLEDARRVEERCRDALKQAETTLTRKETEEMSERIHQTSRSCYYTALYAYEEPAARGPAEATAISREVQVLRHSLEATKLQLQQVRETFAARENAHREELISRYKLNSPELEKVIQAKIKLDYERVCDENLETRHLPTAAQRKEESSNSTIAELSSGGQIISSVTSVVKSSVTSVVKSSHLLLVVKSVTRVVKIISSVTSVVKSVTRVGGQIIPSVTSVVKSSVTSVVKSSVTSVVKSSVTSVVKSSVTSLLKNKKVVCQNWLKTRTSINYKERLQELEVELADARKLASQAEILKQLPQAQESVIEGLKRSGEETVVELAQQGATLYPKTEVGWRPKLKLYCLLKCRDSKSCGGIDLFQFACSISPCALHVTETHHNAHPHL